MPKILVIYDSETGNTEKSAKLFAKGARKVKGLEVKVKKVDKVSLNDLKDADGIAIGSPTYYGEMSWRIKRLIDKSVKIHGELEGKVGTAFTTSGGIATGAETTLLSILQAMLVHGMIVQGDSNDKHYGLAIVGEPKSKDEKELCIDKGKKFAELVAKIFS